jgi:hypothetical protein
MTARCSAKWSRTPTPAPELMGGRSPEFLVFALMFGLLAAGALLLFAATEEPWLLVAVPVLAILGVVGWVLRRRPT